MEQPVPIDAAVGGLPGVPGPTSRWRSVLFVPGNRPDLAAKAPRSQPDAVIIDLEDAVPSQEKESARESARRAAEELIGSVPVCIRVNAPRSPWFDADLAALPAGLAAVVVPKWEEPLVLDHPVVAGLETVRGVEDAGAALGGSAVACYFGAEDFIADLGGVRTASNHEVIYARSRVVIAARLAGVHALDMVTVDFADDARFDAEAAEARALGFAGKLCIHPRQVARANAAFLPSAAERDRAERLLAAFAAAGGRTIAFEGQMVDEVIAELARAVLAQPTA